MTTPLASTPNTRAQLHSARLIVIERSTSREDARRLLKALGLDDLTIVTADDPPYVDRAPHAAHRGRPRKASAATRHPT